MSRTAQLPAGVHHVGASVADLERACSFWESFLDRPPLWRRLLDGDYLGEVTGYPGIRIDAAMFELPGGVLLELLEYQGQPAGANEEATHRPGHVHLCLLVDDMDAVRARALELGARPVAPRAGEVSAGPNAGARAGYLRVHDGISVELFQAPPEGSG